MSRETIIGIDLGTTNSLVASVDAGIAMVLANKDGERITPSIINIEEDEIIVGSSAKRSRHLKPKDTYSSVKRFIGRRANEVSDEEVNNSPNNLLLEGNKPVRFQTKQGPQLPEEISSYVIKQLVQTAEFRLECEIKKAVITVPAYFNDAQRQATQRAGELAGLTVERIINEPTAAALAFGIDKSHTNAKIAVYDLGGGTFDISILQLSDGVFQVLSTSGDTQLGGDDIDRALYLWVIDQIKEDNPNFDISPESSQKILAHVEEAKIRLSSEPNIKLSLPFIDGTYSFETSISRELLNKIALPNIKRTRTHCLRALQDAQLDPTDLDEVVLVGGQTKMPSIREYVNELFQCSDFDESKGNLRVGIDPHKAEGPKLNTVTNPDESIATGASIQGGILSGALSNVILMDVTPLSLGIETFGGLMNVIIPRNTTIPVKAGEMFTNALDYQKEMCIRVLQGEREKADDNWELGQLILPFDPQPKATARVGVQFEIDSNGILHVLTRNTQSGREKTLEIKSAVDVDDQDVQSMVEESVEYALSDMEFRQWTEAKARGTQTLEAAKGALESFGDSIGKDEFKIIEDTISEVESLLKNEDEETGIGDTHELKKNLQALDHHTAPLADLMMEKISEQWLQSQGLIE